VKTTLAFVVLLPTLAAGASASVVWPEAKVSSPAYQADAFHDGFVADPKLEPPLKQKWEDNFGSGVSYPIVGGSFVFVTSGSTFYALRAHDGKTAWTATAPSGTDSWIGAAYDSDKIFVQAEYAFSYQPSLYAFGAKSGKPLWAASLPGQYAFSSPPVATGGIVYTGGAGTGGTVYAFNEKTGAPLWTGEVENGDNSSPVVAGANLYVSYACPQTYDFNAQTGAPVWHYSGPCEGGGGSTAVLNGGLLFVEDSSVYQDVNGLILNASTGAVAGSFDAQFPPAFGGSAEFLVTGGGQTLEALTPATQKTLWTAPLGGGASFLLPPFVVNDVVYEETSAGSLVAYSASSGNVISTYPVSPGSGSAYGMGAGDNLLLVPSGSGSLYAFEHQK
jgi:outer membrane protein assembly factor BamB